MQAALPELGTLNQREIATPVGVAPLNDESGKRSGTRHIRGGRAEIRAVLYMATRTASRANPVIKTFYQRLLARGKAQKVAMTAAPDLVMQGGMKQFEKRAGALTAEQRKAVDEFRAAHGIADPIVQIDHFGGYWIKNCGRG